MKRRFVICLENSSYRTSLIVRKVYQTIPDRAAEQRGMLRVIDESGEDYLFPVDLFSAIEIPRELQNRMST